jgi:hypothetical protein
MLTGAGRVLVLAVLLVTGGTFAATTTASAAGRTQPAPDPGTVQTSDAKITVTVSGSGYKSGSPGSDGSGTVRVSSPEPCWMAEGLTGAQYYESVVSGELARMYKHTLDEIFVPRPGYELHKADVKGHWYGPLCSQLPGQNTAEFLTLAELFTAAHQAEYVEANQSPSIPPVSPELLRETAINNLYVPPPELNWNPKRLGNQGTLVNLETWFWLENPPPKTLTVRAAAAGSEATVTVTFDGMEITAPGELAKSCPGTGTPYTPGAHDPTCALMFSHASSALGTDATAVTVNTSWTGTWESNGQEMGPITPQPNPRSATEHIVVDEVQTLVTGAH